MNFDLPPALYNGLQKIVHGDYEAVGAIIGSMRNQHPGRALELGCGTGALSRFFTSGTYAGIDIDQRRVELARKLNPGHEFLAGDVTTLDSSKLAQFAFVFCHACVHHIDDSGVNSIIAALDRASEFAGKPLYWLIMEPVLPEKTFSNVPGFLLGKIDRGRYVRKCSDLKALLGHRIRRFETSSGPWFWPIPGMSCVLEFLASSQNPEPESQPALLRRGAHA